MSTTVRTGTGTSTSTSTSAASFSLWVGEWRYCPGCRAEQEFVAPDLDEPTPPGSLELACVLCGWALVEPGPSPASRVSPRPA